MSNPELRNMIPEIPPVGPTFKLIYGEAPNRAFFNLESDKAPDIEKIKRSIDSFETGADIVIEVLAEMGFTDSTAEHLARKEQLRSLFSKAGHNTSDIMLVDQLLVDVAPRLRFEARIRDMEAYYHENFFNDGQRDTEKIENEIFSPTKELGNTMLIRSVADLRATFNPRGGGKNQKALHAGKITFEAEQIARLLAKDQMKQGA